MRAFIPTSQQLVDAWFITSLVFGIAIVLGIAWAVLDYGIDLVAEGLRSRTATILRFERKRRANGAALRGDRS